MNAARPISMVLFLTLSMAVALGAQREEWEGPPEGRVEVSSFVVVVHASNPLDSLPATTVANYFLKKLDKWPNGTEVLPVDQKVDAKVRSLFTLVVHFKRPEAIQNYWQQKLFAGEAVPPPEIGTDVEVLEFVSKNPGAIGYVSGDWKLSAEVKVLNITQ